MNSLKKQKLIFNKKLRKKRKVAKNKNYEKTFSDRGSGFVII